MIPITLSISGFLSYRDPVEVDFSSFDLACIAGRNGAGKSSILDAITWALFGQARQRGDAVINTQCDTAEVGLIFQYEENIYRVQRINPQGKTGFLEFHIAQFNSQLPVDSDQSDQMTTLPTDYWTLSTINWKPLTERTMRETQARLEETLRLDYETFVNAAFFLQGKADQFTQQRPGDRKRILANILGLEVWEKYRKSAVDRRKTVEGQVASLDGRLAEINSELAEEDLRKERLKTLQAELEQLITARQSQQESLKTIEKTIDLLAEQSKMVDVLAQGLASSKGRLNELRAKLDTRNRELESYAHTISRADEIKDEYSQWLGLKDELSRWEDIAEQFREHEKRRQEPLMAIETERARLSQEVENLQEQATSLEREISSIPDLQGRISALQSLTANLETQLEGRRSLEEELIDAQDRLADARAENPRLKADMDALKARIDRLTESDGAMCPLCGQPLSVDERQRLIGELNEQGKEMGDKFRANRNLLDEADQKVADLKARIEELQPLDDDLREQTRNLDQLSDQVIQIENKQAAWKKDGEPRLGELQRILAQDDFAHETRTELALIDAELKEIGYDAAAHDAARRAETERRQADDDHRELEKALAVTEPLEREITELQKEINQIEAEIEEQSVAHEEAVAALAAAEEDAPDIRQAQRDFLDMQEKENQLRMQVGAAQQKVLVLDDLRVRRQTIEVEREGLAKEIGQYKQLEIAFGKDGVPALLIEQALPTIEARANELLERLSAGEMSIRFETQRELKTRDNLKETLDIQIHDRAGARDYEMFSGGEAFRVNFAIRLALSETLAQRAGARLQTLVIDEGFGSQDEIGRQRLLEAINLVKADFAKILVITHIDELKDAFPVRIEVEKTELGSTVRVV